MLCVCKNFSCTLHYPKKIHFRHFQTTNSMLLYMNPNRYLLLRVLSQFAFISDVSHLKATQLQLKSCLFVYLDYFYDQNLLQDPEEDADAIRAGFLGNRWVHQRIFDWYVLANLCISFTTAFSKS